MGKKNGIADFSVIDHMKTKYKVKSGSELTLAQYGELIAWMEQTHAPEPEDLLGQ